MKKWNAPAINCVDINKTEHNWLGLYRDGGYIGDGEVSGHLQWDKPECPQPQPQPQPQPVDPVDPVDLPS